jgi:hypothetical protein
VTDHGCYPRCAGCVRDLVQARDLARAQLLPLATRTVPVTYTNRPKEGTREPAAA